jgi:electron transport complex protein RnfD
MQIIEKSSPHLRRPTASVTRMMRDVTIALLPIIIFAIIQHGLTAVWILLAAVISMALTEYIYYQLLDLKEGKPFTLINDRYTIYNYSIIVSGLIYGLIIPDATPIMVVIIGGVVGVFLTKLVFGGMGHNIFNIAAFSRMFIALAFGGAVAVSKFLPEVDAVTGATVLSEWISTPFLQNTNFSLWQMFSGIGFPGTIGETSALLILVGALYLGIRKSFDVFIPVTYIVTVFLLSTAVMITQDLGFWYPLSHILSGGIMFGVVFMATDPITGPVTRPGRIYFAFGIGVVTFAIRLFGNLPEGVVFAILFMNMLVPAIDYPKWSKNNFTIKRLAIFGVIVLLTLVMFGVGANYVN